MTDENNDPKIIDLKEPQPIEGVPVKIDLSAKGGVVEITFDPAITRARFRPAEAIRLATAILVNAIKAEEMSQSSIVTPGQ